MAFNWQTFKTRSLTAAVFVAVMLTGLLWNQWSFLLLFSVIHFGCWWEYLQMMEKIYKTTFNAYVKLGLMVMGYGFMLWFCDGVWKIGGYGLRENFSLPVTAAGFAVLLIGIFQRTVIKPRALGAAALGWIYISLCWGLILDLFARGGEFHVYDTMLLLGGYAIPVIIIASLWINDTMAYIVGSIIGKTPFSKISPKKTWEGTIGGVVLSVVVVSLLLPPILFGSNDRALTLFIAPISLVAAIMGTIGDLFESKLKRMADEKDSGTLLPGHGGFLDRFDSLLLAIPSVWILLHLLN